MRRLGIGLLSFLLFICLLPPAADAADRGTDPFLISDQNFNFGQGASQSKEGGVLGWQQYQVLEGYMNMYEATQNRGWLDKLSEQGRIMIANSEDHDSDGFNGWPDLRYAHNLLKNRNFAVEAAPAGVTELMKNGSFEMDNDSNGIPDSWIRQGNAARTYRSASAGDFVTGATGLLIESDGANSNRLVQSLSLRPRMTYVIEGFIGLESEVGEARIEIFNTATNQVSAYVRAHHIGFERYVFNFTVPASGGTFQLRLGLENYQASGYKARFDDISVKQVDEVLRNGTFENASVSDPTLPADWNRWHASTSSNIYMTSTPANVHTGSGALAIETDNSTWEIAYQDFDYLPGETYRVSVWGRNSSLDAGGRVNIFNATDNTTIATKNFSGTTWARYTVDFIAPEVKGKTVRVRLYQTDWTKPGFVSYFDNILIEPVTKKSVLLNTGFEGATAGDASLPTSWIRGNGATSNDVYQSVGINRYFTGTRGLAIEANDASEPFVEQSITYTPSELYSVSWNGRVSNPAIAARIEIYDATANTVLAYRELRNTRWSEAPLTFTAPSAVGRSLLVRLSAPDASTGDYEAYFDNVEIKPIVSTDAAGWERISTDLAHAHRTDAGAGGLTGDWIMELVHDPAAPPVISQQLFGYKPAAKYGFAIAAKVTPGAVGTLRAVDRTTGITLASRDITNSDAILTEFMYFDTPSAAGHELRMEMTMTSGAAGDRMLVNDAFAGQRWEQMVQEANIMNPLLRFVNAVYDNPELHTDYKSEADEIRDFVAANLVHKWDPYWRQISGTDGSDNGTGVYALPLGTSTEWFPGRTLAHNQYLAYARMLYLLHDATADDPAYASERPLYWSRANDMNRAFKSVLRPHPLNAELGTDAYHWDYWNAMGDWDEGHYISVFPNEDMPHAALTLTGPLEAYKHGQVFDLDDMIKFTRTFTDVMWNQSLSDPIMSYGNSRRPTATSDKTRSANYFFWANYIPINPTILDISEASCKLEPCPGYIGSILAKWSRNKTVNVGFEDIEPTDATLPVFWTRYNSVAANVYRDDSDAALGHASMRIVGDNGSIHGFEQRLFTYEPDTSYSIQLKGKADAGTTVTADVYDYTAQQQLGFVSFSDESWTNAHFAIRTPSAAGHDVRVRVYTEGSASIDEVYSFPSDHNSSVPNGSFEVPDQFDDTLPRFWQRGGLTTANGARTDLTESQSGVGSLKISTVPAGSRQELLYSWRGYRPGGPYTITAAGKTNGTLAGGSIVVVDATTSTLLAEIQITGTSWDSYNESFTAPTAYDHVLQVIVAPDNPAVPGGLLWVDDVALNEQ